MTPMKLQKQLTGFSLIELMIVVVIMGILMAIAIPSYNDYVVRGKIPDATSALSNKRVLMEQFFQDNRTYAAAPACVLDTTTSNYYDFRCASVAVPGTFVDGTATAFVLTAVGKSSMAAFTYTIDQAGVKTSAIDATAPTGWTATSASCWITNKGGLC